jgi:hypothetical protein
MRTGRINVNYEKDRPDVSQQEVTRPGFKLGAFLIHSKKHLLILV